MNIQKKPIFFKIIVPNYNNMSYIKKCLDSILNQTFQDFKIIVVDDQSTDLSDKFCESYARKYPDKIIYHKLEKKGYAGAARNWALDYPLDCEYIWFVDSDDKVYSNTVLENLHKLAIKSNPDLIRCSFYYYFNNNNKNYYSIENKHNIKKIFSDGAGPPKNCINAKFGNIKFKENRANWDDVIWFLRLMDNIDFSKIVKTDFPCYFYNCVSITSVSYSNKNFSQESIDAQIMLYSDLENEQYSNKYCIQRKINKQIESKKIFNDYDRHKQYISSDNIIAAICNFNTTDLTNTVISGLLKYSNASKIIILDNSNKEKFKLKDEFKNYNIQILDNTKQKYINFDLLLKLYNLEKKCVRNNYASLKHTMSIQFLLNITTSKYLLLCDSDIIINKQIDFIEDGYITIADIEYTGTSSIGIESINNGKTRFIPFIQVFNIKLLKKYNIQYFDILRMHGINNKISGINSGFFYDTGASFYEDVVLKQIPYKKMSISEYITHLGHGSWSNNI